LASAILGTTSPADFLSNGEAITAAYTANVYYKNATIVLEGEFSFEVAGTKASLLSKFDDAIEDITVADIVRTGENITVTFAEDVAVSAVKDAANEFAYCFKVNCRWHKHAYMLPVKEFDLV
jgi:hypothetical protein